MGTVVSLKEQWTVLVKSDIQNNFGQRMTLFLIVVNNNHGCV